MFFLYHFRFCPITLSSLAAIKEIFELFLGSYTSNKPINITGIDKILLKCDSNDGSIVNGIREFILFNFAPSSPTGHKIYKEPSIKLFKRDKKSVVSHTCFRLEDDDHNPVDFNGETVSFTCQLTKIYQKNEL